MSVLPLGSVRGSEAGTVQRRTPTLPGERSYRPEGIEARIAHGRRHLAKQRREKADAAFLKGILNGH